MSIDQSINRPLLAWGQTNFSAFLNPTKMNAAQLAVPLSVAFVEPYPVFCRDFDLIMFGGLFAGSEKLKTFFEKLRIYGVQFVPLSIVNDRNEPTPGYYAIHFWNRIAAIDKSNYEGDELNEFNRILHLRKFSLNPAAIRAVPKQQRQIFMLSENSLLIIVHNDVRLIAEQLGMTGVCFSRVDLWEGMNAN